VRSFLFVPGDSAKKLKRASEGAADALILDLEDSVSADEKQTAREETREMLESPRASQSLWVRVNALDTGLTKEDLAAVMPAKPDGIVLPKCSSSDDVNSLAEMMGEIETGSNAEIIGIATETADSVLGLITSYNDCSPKLWGLMWGAEDLMASLGASVNKRDGDYTEPFRLARNLCLMAASAAGIAAIDTVFTDIDNLDALKKESAIARQDGFSAKAVIHPKHVDIVNAAFTPTENEVVWAKNVLAAFEADPEAGVVKIDGKMIDKPHQKAAQKILDMAAYE